MCSLLIGGNLLYNFKTDYAEDLQLTEGWQRAGWERRKSGIMVGLVELSCRQPEGFSRWFLLPPLS